MTRLSPIKILLGWIVFILVLVPFAIYNSKGTVGGEPKLVTTVFTLSNVTVIGATLICVVTPLLFKGWLKANKWFVILTVFLLVATSMFIFQNYFAIPYSFEEQFQERDGNKIHTKTEYYDINNRKVRSRSVWKNGKKDSLWTRYEKDGTVKTKTLYRNDSLVEIPKNSPQQ